MPLLYNLDNLVLNKQIVPEKCALLGGGTLWYPVAKPNRKGSEESRMGQTKQPASKSMESLQRATDTLSTLLAQEVRELFETEVPEIYDGTVEIKAVSREAGSRTKMAVTSKNPDVDAVGACIGPRGARVSKIVEELGGEKIDIVEYSDDPVKFISAALSPATVTEVALEPDGSHACHVAVPDNQLSLAIGNRGQNARLAARLTGWKIDIRPESAFRAEQAEAAQHAADEPAE